ncbi:MAG TPA: hypothetical protein VL362_03690, partial [Patescibacteria group bacterium]|nr:hypothetical protein [Patescibacteria group bacterium]
MKVSIRTCLNVLRLFGEADELDVPKNIERLEISHPSKINTLAVFRFKFRRYALLFDDTAEDDVQYIELELMRALPVTDGELLENPQHVGSYGMPYEGKDCYLY